MKKLLYIFFATALFTGCSKDETDLTFGKTPEERMNETLTELKSTLVNAPNGWVAGMGTGTKGGYGFYLDFSEDDKLSMLSDYSNTSSKTAVTSTYRIKWGTTASLIFDTYNYITLLQDPVPSVAGGAAGKGYQSDIEFNLERISGDSVIFVGKKYKNPLVLVKASTSEKDLYAKGEYSNSISKIKSFFTNNAFTKLNLNNQDYQISFDMDKKTATSTNFSESGSSSSSAKFFITLGSIEFIDGLLINDILFKRFILNESGNLIGIDNNNKEYAVAVQGKPIFPFELYFKYNGIYNAIYTEGNNMPGGVVSDFNTLWSSQLSNYQANNVTMISMTFRLTTAKQAKLEVYFRSGTTNYLADASYDYVITGNTIKLSNYVPSVSNANWNNGWVIAAIKNYFIDAEFDIQWVESSTSKSAMIGGLVKKGTPTSFYYGSVKKQ